MGFLSLLGQAIFLFLFGCVTSEMGWALALVVLVIFSIFVNMAEGTSYGIVPYMIPEQLAVVSAMVGAGGTLGAVVATRTCYMTTDDDLLPFKLHAIYVLVSALSVIPMRWETMGWMFGGVRERASVYQDGSSKATNGKSADTSIIPTPATTEAPSAKTEDVAVEV